MRLGGSHKARSERRESDRARRQRGGTSNVLLSGHARCSQVRRAVRAVRAVREAGDSETLLSKAGSSNRESKGSVESLIEQGEAGKV